MANNKEQNAALERVEINKWLQYLANQPLDLTKTADIVALKESINKIINCEMLALGFDECEFQICYFNDTPDNYQEADYVACYDRRKFMASVKINLAKLLRRWDADTETRLIQCGHTFKIIFHELQHAYQDVMIITGVSSKANLTYAHEFAAWRGGTNGWYNQDWQHISIENNANEVSKRKYVELLGITDSHKVDEYLFEHGKAMNDTYQENVLVGKNKVIITNDGQQERDDILVPVLDELISNQKKIWLLQEYPLLQKEYNIDGSRKNLSTLVHDLETEQTALKNNADLTTDEVTELSRDSRAMYYELIYRALEKSLPEHIQQVNPALWTKMRNYFADQLVERQAASQAMAQVQCRGVGLCHKPDEVYWQEHEQRSQRYQKYFQAKIAKLDAIITQKNMSI